jgi:hypothetical protein
LGSTIVLDDQLERYSPQYKEVLKRLHVGSAAIGFVGIPLLTLRELGFFLTYEKRPSRK